MRAGKVCELSLLAFCFRLTFVCNCDGRESFIDGEGFFQLAEQRMLAVGCDGEDLGIVYWVILPSCKFYGSMKLHEASWRLVLAGEHILVQ